MTDQAETDHPLSRCTDSADPMRCQGVNARGQCWNKKAPHSDFCMMHGGNRAGQTHEKEETAMYLVDLYKARIARQKNHPEVKSLSNEIGLLRMVLESKLQSCTSDTELVMHAAAIGELVMKIDKVVNSCHKLERNMGLHLDKAVLLQFASEIVQLIANTVTNKEEIEKLADGIMDIINNVDGSKT